MLSYFLDWPDYVDNTVTEWQSFYEFWTNEATKHQLPLFILDYNALRDNFNTSIAKVAAFLDVTLTPTRKECIYLNRMGEFKRPRTVDVEHILQLLKEQQENSDQLRNRMGVILRKCMAERHCFGNVNIEL